jgi:hypothetical protein
MTYGFIVPANSHSEAQLCRHLRMACRSASLTSRIPKDTNSQATSIALAYGCEHVPFITVEEVQRQTRSLIRQARRRKKDVLSEEGYMENVVSEDNATTPKPKRRGRRQHPTQQSTQLRLELATFSAF